MWQSSALVIPTKTLNTGLAPNCDDIEPIEATPVKVSKEKTMKTKNHWERSFLEQKRIRIIPRVEKNKNMKIQDMLCTGMGVLLVTKVVELVDSVELNCWRRGKRKNDSDRSFRLRFSAQENADTFSNSDLPRQQAWSHASNMLWTEKSYNILHFISCGFHQRSWFPQNHFEMR